MPRRLLLPVVRVLLLLVASSATAAEREFQVTFSKAVRSEPYSGRVYLFFEKNPRQEPRFGPDWFHPGPCLAIDVSNWMPDEPLGMSSGNRLLSFPKPLAELDLAGSRVQAVARFNPYERRVGDGPGNGYSPVAEVAAQPDNSARQELSITKLVEQRPFPENRWFKEISVRSRLLSEFHQRPIVLRGAVLLPASYYDQPDRRYPVLFEVPGFGSTHFEYGPGRPLRAPTEPIHEKNDGGVELLRVTLDPSCPLGHHVFADSDNNGPAGKALVTEFIPEFERQFRAVAAPTARFLTGHSSGGWSSLWLQVTFPDVFGGTWSTSPDPVDFRDFQQINLYRPGENMYRNPAGERRPIARIDGKPFLWYDDFDHMEEILGYGGQLHSFEAVFSPRDADGRPVRIWDRATGRIDTNAAKAWEKYDIRLILETRWPELAPKLAGKLHVIQGELDTFYLDGATRLLKESLAALKSDAVIEIVPGKTHFDLLTTELRTRMRSEIVKSYLQHHSSPQ